MKDIIDGPMYENEMMTPERAVYLLSTSVNNRKISLKTIVKYKEMMERGEWMLNGEPIAISKDGRLLNGQHRLSAIIQHGKAVPMTVAKNVDKDAFRTIDNGKKRSLGNSFSITGQKNNNLLAATVALYYRYLENEFKTSLTTEMNLSFSQASTLVEKNPDIENSVQFAVDYRKECKGLISQSIVAALHYIFGRKNKEQADEFFKSVLTGEDLTKEDPILTLRAKLIDLNKVFRPRKIRNNFVALLIKTWNYKYGYTNRKRILYSLGDDMPDILPIHDSGIDLSQDE